MDYIQHSWEEATIVSHGAQHRCRYPKIMHVKTGDSFMFGVFVQEKLLLELTYADYCALKRREYAASYTWLSRYLNRRSLDHVARFVNDMDAHRCQCEERMGWKG